VLVLLFLFVLGQLYAEIFVINNFALRPLVFCEDKTVVYGAGEQIVDYDVNLWSAGVYLPFGRFYRLTLFGQGVTSSEFYSENVILLNNIFNVYNFERGGGIYVLVVPKLIMRNYGKLEETLDPAFRSRSKGSLDAGVFVRYGAVMMLAYGRNVNRPDFGVVSSDIVKDEYGVKGYIRWRIFTAGVNWREGGRYEGELMLNYPSFSNFYVFVSNESLAYGLSLEVGRIVLGFKYTIFKFSPKPQVFLEYRL